MIVRVIESKGTFKAIHPEWSTPDGIWNELNAEFQFTMDAAANEDNSKCVDFLTDGLNQEWLGVVWCNPPYGYKLGDWIKKGFESAQAGATVVFLLPVRTCNAWFHEYALCGEIRFVRKRLKFGGAKINAPFDSMVVIFRPKGNDPDCKCGKGGR